MEGPRPPSETELNQIYTFLDQELRPNTSWSITNEYPLAFSKQNMSNIRVITENDEILSHAVMRPIHVKTQAGLFKIAAIGSVVTSSEHRNQGLSTKILESCLESAEKSGCEIAILWTSMHDFYRKLGFELAGSEMSVYWHREANIPTNGLKFMESQKVAPEAIHKLYNYHTITSLRTLADTAQYLQIPNMKVYTAWDAQNQIKAYAVEGKGADLKGHIHEWGGGVSALLPLFDFIYKTRQEPITIMIPKHSVNMLKRCEELGFAPNEGFLGMLKPINTASLFTKVKRYARMQGISDFVLEQKENKFILGFASANEKNLFTTDSLTDVTRLLFGPQTPGQIYPFEPEVKMKLEKFLPLDLWIWGWDSI